MVRCRALLRPQEVDEGRAGAGRGVQTQVLQDAVEGAVMGATLGVQDARTVQGLRRGVARHAPAVGIPLPVILVLEVRYHDVPGHLQTRQRCLNRRPTRLPDRRPEHVHQRIPLLLIPLQGRGEALLPDSEAAQLLQLPAQQRVMGADGLIHQRVQFAAGHPVVVAPPVGEVRQPVQADIPGFAPEELPVGSRHLPEDRPFPFPGAILLVVEPQLPRRPLLNREPRDLAGEQRQEPPLLHQRHDIFHPPQFLTSHNQLVYRILLFDGFDAFVGAEQVVSQDDAVAQSDLVAGTFLDDAGDLDVGEVLGYMARYGLGHEG